MSELISIIVPVYNVEKYLRYCIDSIINQSYQNLEIILVDDGSPDNCPMICDEYQKKDKRIKVIHKNNGGLSDARNAGLKLVTGDYVMFVDSDDTIHPRTIEILFQPIKDSKKRIRISAGKLLSSTHTVNSFPNIGDYSIKYRNKKEVMNLLLEESGQWVNVVCKLFDITLFNGLQFPTNRLYEDTYISYLLYDKANDIADINLNLYFYFLRPDSIMRIHELNEYEDLFQVFLKRLSFFKKNNYTEAFYKQRDYIEFRLHKIYIESTQEKDINCLSKIRKFYRKFYFICFKSFSLKYKIYGFINILLGKV